MTLVPVNTPKQIGACAALAREIWEAFYTPIIGAAQVEYMLRTFQSADAIASQIGMEGYRYYLLTEGEAACGYCATVPDDDALKISKLYVREACRGQGAGRLMLEACEREARERGVGKLRLTVNRHNPSVAFYGRVGFENAGTLVQDIGNGFVMDDYVMVRPVPVG